MKKYKKMMRDLCELNPYLKLKKLKNNIKESDYKILTLFNEKSIFKIHVVIESGENIHIGVSPNFASLFTENDYNEIFTSSYLEKQLNKVDNSIECEELYKFKESSFDNKKCYFEVAFPKGKAVCTVIKDLIDVSMLNSFEKKLEELSKTFNTPDNVNCYLLVEEIENTSQNKTEKCTQNEMEDDRKNEIENNKQNEIENNSQNKTENYIVKGSLFNALTKCIEDDYYISTSSIFFNNIDNEPIRKDWGKMSVDELNSYHTLHPYFLNVEFMIENNTSDICAGKAFKVQLSSEKTNDSLLSSLSVGCSPISNLERYIELIESVGDRDFPLANLKPVDFLRNNCSNITPGMRNIPPLFKDANLNKINVYNVGNALTTILEDTDGDKYIYDVGRKKKNCNDTLYTSKISSDRIKGVIISHWHFDHFNGLSLLRNNNLYKMKWLIREYEMEVSKSSQNVLRVLATIQSNSGSMQNITLIKDVPPPNNNNNNNNNISKYNIFRNYYALVYANPRNRNDSSICLSNYAYYSSSNCFIAGDIDLGVYHGDSNRDYISNMSFFLVPHHGSVHNNINLASFTSDAIACVSCNGTLDKPHSLVVRDLRNIVKQLDLTSNIQTTNNCRSRNCTNWYYTYNI